LGWQEVKGFTYLLIIASNITFSDFSARIIKKVSEQLMLLFFSGLHEITRGYLLEDELVAHNNKNRTIRVIK